MEVAAVAADDDDESGRAHHGLSAAGGEHVGHRRLRRRPLSPPVDGAAVALSADRELAIASIMCV